VPTAIEAASASHIEIIKYSSIIYARSLAARPPAVLRETQIVLVMLGLLTLLGFYTIYIVSARPYSYNAVPPAFH
jgi:hypothetical protein